MIAIVDGGGGCSRLFDGGGGALGRQMVFETSRSPVVCGIGGCSRLLTGGGGVGGGVIAIVDGGGGGGVFAIVDGGGGALGRQMVFEAGRTPVVCGIGSCALLPDFPSYGVARGSNVITLIMR